jgi:hypothetical protein
MAREVGSESAPNETPDLSAARSYTWSVPYENHRSTFITIRLPHQLSADLRCAAERESNSASSVARRLIATGLIHESEKAAADRREDGR